MNENLSNTMLRSFRSYAEPMYASVGNRVPSGRGWTFEPKYDGIRVLAHVTPKEAALVTRNGRDKSSQFPEVTTALVQLAVWTKHPFVVDGEIVALSHNAPARFQELQGRIHLGDARESGRADTHVAFMLFDILIDGGAILLDEPWTARHIRLKELLATLRRVKGGSTVARVLRRVPSIRDGAAMLRKARLEGWEGVIAKDVSAPYKPGVRTGAWLKLKIEFRQELVVGGFTAPRNSRPYMGALLLGYFDKQGNLLYAGHVGGGFTNAKLRTMRQKLDKLVTKTSPFATPIRTNEVATWVKPRIVVEVKFSEWTADGRLRQPIYLGTRDDKDARDVTREKVSVQRTVRKRRQ